MNDRRPTLGQPTNTYTNYEGVKVQNHVLAVFRRNAVHDRHLTTVQRAERMLETLYRLPYGSGGPGVPKVEGWGYLSCLHARRVLRRYVRVFGAGQ